ncbi:MAG: winged helix-turn-helix domain-containing protein [Syntrophobacteraceae bacterium]|jgi:DNA-binding MarR family transcriptional regulator
METIDLIQCIPEKLAEEANLDRLLQTAKSIDRWEERHAEVLDYIYRYQLIRLLVRRSSEDDLNALNEHLERMLHPRRQEAMQHLGRPYGERWAAYKDILESRLASLHSAAPQEVLKMARVKQILELVLRGGATKQTEIQERLGLKPANLTRVLNVMEANELIDRRKEGRENTIHPGPGTDRLLPALKKDTTETDRMTDAFRQRGSVCLRRFQRAVDF